MRALPLLMAACAVFVCAAAYGQTVPLAHAWVGVPQIQPGDDEAMVRAILHTDRRTGPSPHPHMEMLAFPENGLFIEFDQGKVADFGFIGHAPGVRFGGVEIGMPGDTAMQILGMPDRSDPDGSLHYHDTEERDVRVTFSKLDGTVASIAVVGPPTQLTALPPAGAGWSARASLTAPAPLSAKPSAGAVAPNALGAGPAPGRPEDDQIPIPNMNVPPTPPPKVTASASLPGFLELCPNVREAASHAGYPSAAVDAGIRHGVVKVRFTVAAQGGVKNVAVTESTNPVFNATAISVVRSFSCPRGWSWDLTYDWAISFDYKDSDQ